MISVLENCANSFIQFARFTALKPTPDSGVIRAVAPDDNTLTLLFRHVLFADVRYAVWKTARLRRRLDVVAQENFPLRFWVPFKFVEPFVQDGTNTVLSRWWLRAPFQIGFAPPSTPVMEYAYKYETSTHPEFGMLGQLIREISLLDRAEATVLFRWFKH